MIARYNPYCSCWEFVVDDKIILTCDDNEYLESYNEALRIAEAI